MRLFPSPHSTPCVGCAAGGIIRALERCHECSPPRSAAIIVYRALPGTRFFPHPRYAHCLTLITWCGLRVRRIRGLDAVQQPFTQNNLQKAQHTLIYVAFNQWHAANPYAQLLTEYGSTCTHEHSLVRAERTQQAYNTVQQHLSSHPRLPCR